MEIILSISTFFLGCIVGWYTNHWYSVNLKESLLKQKGSGSGSNLFGTSFRYGHVSVENELRVLSFGLPETIIFGKRLKTRFGNQIIERHTAKECRAQLLSEFGKHICHLHWFENESVMESVDIESGKSAKLLLFIRKENDDKFYVYEPVSASDSTPKTKSVPNFNESTNFLVRISYSHNKSYTFPTGVEIDFRGNHYVTTESGEGVFYP